MPSKDAFFDLFQGTVLIKTAAELLDYSKGEETQVEEASDNLVSRNSCVFMAKVYSKRLANISSISREKHNF